MSSLERFTARIVALTRTLRQHPLFAALEPVPVRQRLRLPASGPRNWRRYPGFAEPTGLAGRRSRRAPVSPWHAMVLASAVLAVSGVVTGARAADVRAVYGQSANGNIEDARRQTQIATVYAINPLLRDSVLIVTVNGANVSLVGKTASSVERDLAEEIALSVEGIEHVDNLIGTTDMSTSHPRGDPSFGQKIDDATTTASIRSKLQWGATTSGLAIRIVTVRGKVRLDGTVYENAQRDLIGQIAADTANAQSVTNGIVVFAMPPVTVDAQADMRKLIDDSHRPVSDAWITAHIQSTYLLSPSINRSAITVATSEGSVSLTGVADSPSSRSSAIELARNTRGVLSVDGTRLMVN